MHTSNKWRKFGERKKRKRNEKVRYLHCIVSYRQLIIIFRDGEEKQQRDGNWDGALL